MKGRSLAIVRTVNFWASAVLAVALIGIAAFMRDTLHLGSNSGPSLAQGGQCAKNDALPSVSNAEESDVIYFVGCGGFF